MTNPVKDRQQKLLAVIQTLTPRRPVFIGEVVAYLVNSRSQHEGLDQVYITTDGQDDILSGLMQVDLDELKVGGFIEVFDGTVQCNRRNATC